MDEQLKHKRTNGHTMPLRYACVATDNPEKQNAERTF